jgi:hypothetical protein
MSEKIKALKNAVLTSFLLAGLLIAGGCAGRTVVGVGAAYNAGPYGYPWYCYDYPFCYNYYEHYYPFGYYYPHVRGFERERRERGEHERPGGHEERGGGHEERGGGRR